MNKVIIEIDLTKVTHDTMDQIQGIIDGVRAGIDERDEKKQEQAAKDNG